MIDIRLAREHPDEFRRALARKGAAADFENFLTVDGLWRELTTEVDELRRRTRPKGKPTEEERAALVLVSEELRQAEAKLEELDRRRSDLLAGLPNPPDDSVPDGYSDEDAVELRRVGDGARVLFPATGPRRAELRVGRLRWRRRRAARPRPGTRGEGGRCPVCVPAGCRRARGAGAVQICPGPAGGTRLRTCAPAGAGAGVRHVWHRLPADRRGQSLPGRQRRALPDRNLRGCPRRRCTKARSCP